MYISLGIIVPFLTKMASNFNGSLKTEYECDNRPSFLKISQKMELDITKESVKIVVELGFFCAMKYFGSILVNLTVIPKVTPFKKIY